MQLHIERGSRISEVKRGSHILAQPLNERDSRVLKVKDGASPSATVVFECQHQVKNASIAFDTNKANFNFYSLSVSAMSLSMIGDALGSKELLQTPSKLSLLNIKTYHETRAFVS